MGTDSEFVILYRIAEKKNKNSKVKPEWVNNTNCLNNMKRARSLQSELIVFGDNLDESLELVDNGVDKYIPTTAHGNAETFLEVFDYALNNYSNNDIVYFVEDDYIHRQGFEEIIRQGLTRADYVSLYDHPDKYGRETMPMFVTESSHWKYTGSTTMTFAAKVETLAKDAHVFKSLITTGNPPDYYIFTSLTQQFFKRLATPIPAYATHGESEFLAPVIDWEKEL